MPGFNLIRNSRVFVTNNFSTDGAKAKNTVSLGSGGAEPVFSITNAQELSVLDGFSFSQGTTADTITVSEAGSTPTRGQRSFNNALNPVDFSFSTYLRPYRDTTVKADEAMLWNSLLGISTYNTGAITAGTGASSATYTPATGVLVVVGTGMTTAGLVKDEVVHVRGITVGPESSYFNAPAILTAVAATGYTLQYLTAPPNATAFTTIGSSFPTSVTFNKSSWVEHAAATGDTLIGATTPYSEVTAARSSGNQLAPFGLIVTVDGITYAIDNCSLNQASIDFGLDGIAMVAWTGQGTALRQLASNVTYTAAADPILGGGLAGTINGRATVGQLITNKLSTVNLQANVGGTGTTYALALTGGNITIANNISYLTPAALGVVNTPIDYYTGTRSISGNITAYLKTGSLNTAGLLSSMLAATSTTEPKFQLSIAIGGTAATTRVELYGAGASLQIPTVDAQAVMSTTINFSLQGTEYGKQLGTATAGFDLENTNDLRIRYFAPA